MFTTVDFIVGCAICLFIGIWIGALLERIFGKGINPKQLKR